MSSGVDPFIKSVEVDWTHVTRRDAYPFTLPAVTELGRLELDPGVTFLVGENGSGKSTLLEAMAVAAGMNAEGGGRNFNFSTRSTESALGSHLRLNRTHRRPVTDFFLRAETFYNVATAVDEIGTRGYGDDSLHEQSHGESFLALALNRFHMNGLYLLDEPEAALSPQNQLVLLLRIYDLTRQGAQWVIATHSPILLAHPGCTIYELGEDGYRAVAYDDLELVTLYRDFLGDPALFLRHLLAEDDDQLSG
jgi:predicted ATPase